MSTNWQQDVRDFHKKFECHIGLTPDIPSEQIIDLRKRLIFEEFSELMSGIDKNDLIDIADASADLIYVILGTLVSYGIELQPIWDEVQRSNMAEYMGKFMRPFVNH